jgi:hypothetical protein
MNIFKQLFCDHEWKRDFKLLSKSGRIVSTVIMTCKKCNRRITKKLPAPKFIKSEKSEE